VSCGMRHECKVDCCNGSKLNGKVPASYSIGTNGESQMFHSKRRG
jgi:hypothetical protein